MIQISVEYPACYRRWTVEGVVGFTPGVNAGILSLKKDSPSTNGLHWVVEKPSCIVIGLDASTS